ncbi:ATP-binding cassette domain-containing protein [Frankia sp. R82]|uniref:ATP-binding cassette domain-containing protein n=1 Tax=Frankia sp. R82 TaxID=2950553 RepID=UPI002042D49D|nr:ABC transporter ATP-binding protein [Frankia sp. R82]MCM3883834.1 ABC transporter ATP-binding protein [Frankia sp. R82]
MTAALATDGLGHRYGRSRWALRACTLEVPAGRVVALVGPNGSGKSTLLHTAAGLLAPSEGSVHVAGAAPARSLARIGFVAQDAPLWPRLRVAEILEAGRHLNAHFDTPFARGRISQLEIAPRARVQTLSGGQRAQLALTMVLAKHPDLLLLDEPLANLDPVARREFLASMFAACTDSGATVVFSSHVVAELERICDHLIVLRDGRVSLVGDIDDLRESHRIVSGPQGWPEPRATPVICARDAAGRTTALLRCDPAAALGPGLDETLPTFDELVLGYLEQPSPDHQESVR